MASSIIISTAKQLGGLVAKEAQYLYEVSDKIERLERDLRWMHCFLEDADNRQHREKVVAMWVAEIRDLAYEAEEVLERYVHKVSHPRQNGWWNAMKWFSCALCDARALHDVGSNIDDLRIRITELISRLQLYGLKVSKEEESLIFNSATRKQRKAYSYIEEDPVGLEKHTEKVVVQLVSYEDFKVVGICGMGGLGKTTLARQVFQHESTREHFKNNCAWVCISKQFETRVVFRDILMRLVNIKDADQRMELHGLTDEDFPIKIRGILSEKKCLVVLDDLWSKHDWDALKPAFESIRSCGSKILITTRNNDLLQHVHAYSHDLNLLSDEDSWKLFTRIAFSERGRTGNKETSLLRTRMILADDDREAKEKLGGEMLNHCNGLPLAILTLGGILASKKSTDEWRTVKENIASYLMGDMEHENDSEGLFAILELSYKDLPYYLKPCFMYLGNFPEDYEIRADRLYHLWEAEGLVTISADDGDQDQKICLDDIARLHLNELVKRCLVQVTKCSADGRIIACRLHDVMRDVCLKKCKEVNFLNIIKHGSPKEPSSKIASSSHGNRKLRRCAFYLTETRSNDTPFDPSPKFAPCIRSLVVFQRGRDSEPKKLLSPSMSKTFSLLRVLDLQDACIAMHPKSFEDLIHLRYISFKNAKLIPLLPPHIWDCPYLETLDLRWYADDQQVVLSNMFWKLERLRHLYLPPLMRLMGSGRLILTDTQLRQLETMKNFNVGACQITDLHKMTSMRVFTLEYMAFLSTNMEVKQLLSSPMIAKKRLVKPLHLRVNADVFSEEGSLVDTFLDECQTRSHGFDVHGRIAPAKLERFSENLSKLLLSGSEIGQEGISVLEKLPHLKKLTFLNMRIAGNRMSVSGGGFQQLDVLNILNPVELEELEIGEGALPNLRRLGLLRCVDLKMIPDGLPRSVLVWCKDPCISGVQNYNICLHSASTAS